MLGLSVKDFLSGSCEYFEEGPWPCLNPVDHSSDADMIRQYQKVVSRKGRLFGVFSCQCGYTYSRTGPDLEGNSRYSPAKVLATGPASEWNLSHQWLANRPIAEISKSLSTTPVNVRRVAKRLGLPFKRGGRTLLAPTSLRLEAKRNSYRQKYRDELTKCLETNPCSFRNTIARELAPNAMSWLRKNDKDWLLCVLPPVRPRAGPRSRVSWEVRDTELAARVPAAIDHLLAAPGLPRRITAQQIIRALGFSGGLPDPARLQRTVALINTAVESLEECAIRRLNRFVLDAEFTGRQWTFADLLRMSRIRKSWLDDPRVIRAISHAGERIAIRHLPSIVLNDHRITSVAEDEAA
jgi:Tn7-like transposition protein D